MAQDIAQLFEQAKQGVQIVPLSTSAQRATTFELRFDGGAFTLHIYETREAPEPRPAGPAMKWDLVEIARFSLSPVALSRLYDSLNAGQAMYKEVIGRPLITDAENNELGTAFVQKMVNATQVPQKKSK